MTDRKVQFLIGDVETTGLDPTRCMMLEMGFVALDADLAEVASFSVVLLPSGPLDDGNSDHAALALHDKSGLLSEIAAGKGTPMHRAALSLFHWLTTLGVNMSTRHALRLVGNNPWFDRAFLKAAMPSLDGVLHYRMIDVSTLRTVVSLASGVSEAAVKARVLADAGAEEGNHRSLADCRSCAVEFRAYADVLARGLGVGK